MTRRNWWGWLPSQTQLQTFLALVAGGVVIAWQAKSYVPSTGEVTVVLFMFGQRAVTKGVAIKRGHDTSKRSGRKGGGGRSTRMDVDGNPDSLSPDDDSRRRMYGRHLPRRRI